MTTTTARSGQAAPAVTGVVPALPRRRRTGLTALGILAVVLGALVAYLMVATVGTSHPYLAMARTVPYGATITADDLTVVHINAASGLAPIPAADSGQIIGLHATTDLDAGTLLTRAEVAAVTIPAPGQPVLAVELKPGQLPGSVHVGDAIQLVIVPASAVNAIPDPQTTADDTPTSVDATVVAGPVTGSDGNVRVDVAVDPANALTVATMAAEGRIVIVLTGRN